MTTEAEYQIGPAITAMRDAMGVTQDQVARAGGPAASEQTRMSKVGEVVSAAHRTKFATAFDNLGRRDVAEALPAICRLLDGEGLPEVDRPVTLVPSGVVFHHAANRYVVFGLGEVDVDTVRLQTEESLTKDQRKNWGAMTLGILSEADVIFAEQSGRPAPITEEFIDRPRIRFRSSAYNAYQSVLAVDPLAVLLDLYGHKGAPQLATVRAVVAALTEGQPTRSPWTPLLLAHLLDSIPPEERTETWPRGPLGSIMADHGDPQQYAWPDPRGQMAEARHELVELLTPFQDSILDAVEEVEAPFIDTGRPPVVHLATSAITSIDELRRRDQPVAFGPEAAGQASLLAGMVCSQDWKVVTVRDPYSLVVARPYYVGDPPAELALSFVPGMSTVAIAQYRGEPIAVRVHPG